MTARCFRSQHSAVVVAAPPMFTPLYTNVDFLIQQVWHEQAVNPNKSSDCPFKNLWVLHLHFPSVSGFSLYFRSSSSSSSIENEAHTETSVWKCYHVFIHVKMTYTSRVMYNEPYRNLLQFLHATRSKSFKGQTVSVISVCLRDVFGDRNKTWEGRGRFLCEWRR